MSEQPLILIDIAECTSCNHECHCDEDLHADEYGLCTCEECNTWVIFTVRCKIHDCRGQGKFIRAIWYTRLLNIYLKSVGYYRSKT